MAHCIPISPECGIPEELRRVFVLEHPEIWCQWAQAKTVVLPQSSYWIIVLAEWSGCSVGLFFFLKDGEKSCLDFLAIRHFGCHFRRVFLWGFHTMPWRDAEEMTAISSPGIRHISRMDSQNAISIVVKSSLMARIPIPGLDSTWFYHDFEVSSNQKLKPPVASPPKGQPSFDSVNLAIMNDDWVRKSQLLL